MFDRLSHAAADSLNAALGRKDVQVSFEWPSEVGHGDLTTTVCLRLAKQAQRKPQELAAQLAGDLAAHPDVAGAAVAGPGYVNITLKPGVLLGALEDVRKAALPAVPRTAEGPIIIDYSSPNIAKPLGVHHILSTVIGQVLANLYDHAGYTVVRWNYLGDWGTQFGKLAVAFERWGGKKPAAEHTLDELLALYVRFHDEAEKDPALEAAGQEAFKRLEQGDATLRAFWGDVVTVTREAMAGIYERLGVSFDVQKGESAYEQVMAPIVEEGKKKGVFKAGEKGALIVEFPEETKLPPGVVMKADGATLYLTRDLALMRDRIDTYAPQAILWAVDVAQQLYFRQLFATAQQLGWELPTLEHVSFGRMSFADGSMSTRKGNILRLQQVLDEAVTRAKAVIAERGDAIQTDEPEELAEMMGVGALVFSILSQNRKMDLVFDWDKALSFDGVSAPYLQYTFARCCSVLRKAGEEMGDADLPAGIDALAPQERALVVQLLKFPQVLTEAREQHLPHKLAHFLIELAQVFNAFYNAEPILKAEGTTRALRLALTAATGAILQRGADLLTLRLPTRM